MSRFLLSSSTLFVIQIELAIIKAVFFGVGLTFLGILATACFVNEVNGNGYQFNLLDFGGKSLNPSKFQRPYAPVPPVIPVTWSRSFQNTNTTVVPPACTILNDIQKDKPQLNIFQERNQTSRNGLTNQVYRWKNLYIQPDPAFEKWERDVINHAMWNLWQVIPCVNFGSYESNATNIPGDYLRIVKGTNNGCNSYVGRQGGKQILNLESPGCITLGTVMHELLHALGFYHEQCRHDRDDLIDLYLDNAYPEYKFAFDKQSTKDTSTFGVPYNYNSIMHYDSTAFSKNGKVTMLAKNGQNIGSTGELQQTDIQKLKAMYNC